MSITKQRTKFHDLRTDKEEIPKVSRHQDVSGHLIYIMAFCVYCHRRECISANSNGQNTVVQKKDLCNFPFSISHQILASELKHLNENYISPSKVHQT